MKSSIVSAVFSLQACLVLGMHYRELHLSSTSQDHISGSFLDLNGKGIYFEIKPSGFQITDHNRKVIIMTELLMEPNPAGIMQRKIEIKSSSFIQEVNEELQTNVAYYMTADEKESWEKAYHQKDSKGMEEVVSMSKQKSQDVHGFMLQKSVNQLVSDINSRLMVDTAIEMGKQGLTGKKYPILLPFYATCLKMDEMIGAGSSAFSHQTMISRQRRSDKCETFSTCPPCENDECLGLCGNGCNCWSWLCGDCCYHQGCYDHDLCCREGKFDVAACLFPFGFRCDSYSGC